MRISQLDGKRVALWGWGREGRAAYRALRSRLPSLPLTLFCNDEEAHEVAALGEERITGYIKTIGLYRGKARNLAALSRKLVAEHGGKVPDDLRH